ncbi:tRNA splicing endonuclease subunit sen2 [Dispira simplex]|nr:tRNA splicing endonuclease subunit sen2 [Dispira simplex]
MPSDSSPDSASPLRSVVKRRRSPRQRPLFYPLPRQLASSSFHLPQPLKVSNRPSVNHVCDSNTTAYPVVEGLPLRGHICEPHRVPGWLNLVCNYLWGNAWMTESSSAKVDKPQRSSNLCEGTSPTLYMQFVSGKPWLNNGVEVNEPLNSVVLPSAIPYLHPGQDKVWTRLQQWGARVRESLGSEGSAFIVRLRVQTNLSINASTSQNGPLGRNVRLPLEFWVSPSNGDPLAASFLWRHGCFGKGTLSRSEATWWKRQWDHLRLQYATDAEIRTELTRKSLQPEYLTYLRRQLREAGKAASCGPLSAIHTPPESDSSASQSSHFAASSAVLRTLPTLPSRYLQADMEVLKLSAEEALFLSWALDVVDVYDPDQGLHSLDSLWGALIPTVCASPKLSLPILSHSLMIRYVVYHYYRSRGWVVLSGFKFASDYVLYKRGPVFHHSLYSVLIQPVDNRGHPIPFGNSPSAVSDDRKTLTWTQFITANRITTQAQKNLVLCYVVVPDDATVAQSGLDTLRDPFDWSTLLRLYSITELRVERWVPERTR